MWAENAKEKGEGRERGSCGEQGEAVRDGGREQTRDARQEGGENDSRDAFWAESSRLMRSQQTIRGRPDEEGKRRRKKVQDERQSSSSVNCSVQSRTRWDAEGKVDGCLEEVAYD